MGTEHQRQIAMQCKQLALNGLIVLATKAILWKERKDDGNINAEAHSEYLFTWGRVVKYRIVLSHYIPQQHDSALISVNGDNTTLYAARLFYANNTNPSPLPVANQPPQQQFTPKINVYAINDWGLSFCIT
jgi:hypothetical protein